jgi:hypothetical protein
MRNLILISFIVLALSACNISIFHSYHKTENAGNTHNLSSYFNNVDSSYLYQTEIRFLKKYYSGIMVFRPQNDSLTRVVFVTEMGIKVFDFGISNPLKNKDNYKVYYIMEPMSKKIIQKTLINDIGLLLQDANQFPVKNYSDNKDQQIERIKIHGKRFFYTFDKEELQYHQINMNTCCSKKTEVGFFGKQNQSPDSVQINHFGIKLNYIFRRLKQK